MYFDLFSCVGEKEFNDDCIAAEMLKDDVGIFAVADGMGGAKGGNVASNVAISTAIDLLREKPSIPFAELFEHVRSELLSESKKNIDLARMGTTLTLCKIENSQVKVGHVGDSRLYHLRGEGLRTRTKDQTELQKLLEDGVLSKARAKSYPRRHILISVLSPNSAYDLEESSFELVTGDRLLLLTDGVYNVMTKAEIRDLSLQSQDVHALCDSLRNQIERRDHKDDYSAICIEYS